MSFTETTHESWFSRIGGALKGILVGGLLFLIAFPLEFWNEGRAVNRSKTLAEGKGAVVADVPTDSINKDNEGKLVHISGEATAPGVLTDSQFGITAPDVLKLQRHVEMYQWHEKVSRKSKKKLGGGKKTEKTYSYSKDWSANQIDSAKFHEKGRSEYGDGNPPMPFTGEIITAESIGVGAFQLNDSLVSMISGFNELDVTDQLDSVPESLKQNLMSRGGGFYVGSDPANPQIGDLRIKFAVIKPSVVSLLSQQSGDSFVAYSNSTGSIEDLRMGKHSAASMFEAMEAENTALTWILRGVGVAMMVGGIGMMLSPLSVLADIVPIVGNIVGAGTWLIAVLVGGMFSLTTISIAWIFYRPLIGIPLLVGAMVLGFLAWKRTSAKSQDTESVSPATA